MKKTIAYRILNDLKNSESQEDKKLYKWGKALYRVNNNRRTYETNYVQKQLYALAAVLAYSDPTPQYAVIKRIIDDMTAIEAEKEHIENWVKIAEMLVGPKHQVKRERIDYKKRYFG